MGVICAWGNSDKGPCDICNKQLSDALIATLTLGEERAVPFSNRVTGFSGRNVKKGVVVLRCHLRCATFPGKPVHQRPAWALTSPNSVELAGWLDVQLRGRLRNESPAAAGRYHLGSNRPLALKVFKALGMQRNVEQQPSPWQQWLTADALSRVTSAWTAVRFALHEEEQAELQAADAAALAGPAAPAAAAAAPAGAAAAAATAAEEDGDDDEF